MVWLSSLLLVMQTYIALTGAVVRECETTKANKHNASSLCHRGSKNDFSCDHQLRGFKETQLCTLKYIDPKSILQCVFSIKSGCDWSKRALLPYLRLVMPAVLHAYLECQMASKVKTYNYNELPFSLTVYRLSTWMVTKTSFNLSFPSPDWSHIAFHYRHQDDIEATRKMVCYRFDLNLKPTTSISDTLFWDCDDFDDDDYHNNSYMLLLMDSEGYGGEYRFRVPDEKRIDRNCTSIENWQVFHFLHMSYINEYRGIPVTIQLAPFDQVSYNVTLVQCLDAEKDKCVQRKPIAYRVIPGPSRFEITEGEDGNVTVMFEHQKKLGKYAVVVQIIEAGGRCPEECFSSISPIFEFSGNLPLLATLICVIVLLGIFLMLTWFAWKCRIKMKGIIQKRQQHKKSVLLVYSATLATYFDFIKELANYLQQRFQMHLLYVDKDTAGQDPSLWIEKTILTSAKVLFLVPDPSRKAVTPIRSQWHFALSIYSEFYCKDDLYHNKFGVVTFPFSASVPEQITHLRRFHLMDDFNLLVTWIHNESILGKYLLWEPLLSILRTIRTERNMLKSMVTIITKEVESMSVTTSFSDITTTTSPVIQNNYQHQEVECNESIKVQLSCDDCNIGVSSPVGSVVKFEQSTEDVFDDAVPRPQFLPIFGDEPHVHCATKSADMDPPLRNAFFGM